MIVYVQGQEGGCVKVACDLAYAVVGCAEQCGGSGAADTDEAYASGSGCWDKCGDDWIKPAGEGNSYAEACNDVGHNSAISSGDNIVTRIYKVFDCLKKDCA